MFWHQVSWWQRELGFNNAYFLYAAMLDATVAPARSHQLATGMLILCALACCYVGWIRLLRRGTSARWHDIYSASLSVPILVWAVNSGNASSPSPDGGVFLVGLMLGALLISVIENHRERPRKLIVSVYVGVFMSLIGVITKISFAAIGAVSSLVLLRRLLRASIPSRVKQRTVIGLLLLSLAVIGPWLVHGVILSGYIGYPASLLAVPVDWRVPTASAHAHADRIVAWARQPWDGSLNTLGNWHWVVPWFVRIWKDYVMEMRIPSAIAVGALLVWSLGGRQRRSASAALLAEFALPSLAGIFLCLLTVPDPRFAGSAFWVIAAGTLGWAYQNTRSRFMWQMLVIVSLLIGGATLHPVDMFRNWIDVGPARSAVMVKQVTRSGLGVYVPASGNQSWDAPLPSTPHFRAILELRQDDGDLSQGFRLRNPVARKRAQSKAEPNAYGEHESHGGR